MNKEQFDKLEKAINSNAALHQGGYLCVGKYERGENLGVRFGVEYEELFMYSVYSAEMVGGKSGNSTGANYYVTKSFFDAAKKEFNSVNYDERILELSTKQAEIQKEINELSAEKERLIREKEARENLIHSLKKEANEGAEKLTVFARHISKLVSGAFLEVRGSGNYKNNGFFLGYEITGDGWEIVKDNEDCYVLVPKNPAAESFNSF